MVNGKLLDLVALLETITKRGGVRRVQDQGLWDEVSPTSKHSNGTKYVARLENLYGGG